MNQATLVLGLSCLTSEEIFILNACTYVIRHYTYVTTYTHLSTLSVAVVWFDSTPFGYEENM